MFHFFSFLHFFVKKTKGLKGDFFFWTCNADLFELSGLFFYFIFLNKHDQYY